MYLKLVLAYETDIFLCTLQGHKRDAQSAQVAHVCIKGHNKDTRHSFSVFALNQSRVTSNPIVHIYLSIFCVSDAHYDTCY